MIQIIKFIALVLAEFGAYAYVQIVMDEFQPKVFIRRKHDKDITTIQR